MNNMAAEPTLDVMTKVRLGAFASDMAITHPSQAKTILTLQDTLEQRLPLNVQNQIIEKLNKDPKGTLAAAKELINKDPKILDEINKNPLKLATVMGVNVAPAPAAPAKAPETKTVEGAGARPSEPTKPAQTAASRPAEARPEPVVIVAAAKPPISDTELADRSRLSKEAAQVTQMPGFEEFAGRAGKDQSLSRAVDAVMGKNSDSTQEKIKSLKDIQSDPQFFVKANKAIDEIPAQMRENVFSQIAENPDLGRQALKGDAGAKMSLTMGSMFGGADGKGLGGMFGGEGMKGFGEMLANLLPRLLEGLKEIFGKLMGGLEKFSQSPGLMRMGNDPDLTRQHGQVVDKTLGTDSRQKPVVDASRPNDPATPMAELGKAPTPTTLPEQQRKLETQQPGALGAAT
jgi:hypothetical protein